jgi:hypothetical protein
MKQFLIVTVNWTCALYCFANSYFAFRFPERYIKARWTVMSGLPPEPSSAAFGGILTTIGGAMFFAGGWMVLRSVFAQ